MNEPLLEFMIGPQDITEADGAFKFSGVAVYENAMSGNMRFYPSSFIDESIAKTSAWHAAGHVTTIHRSHMAAYEGALPVGKAVSMEHKDGALRFEGSISKTADGSDLVKLVRDGVIARMSIRSSQYDSAPEKMETSEGKQTVDVMQWAVIEGIDFCERPGITGAGITRILESAPTWAQKENDMEWSEITLETLRENRGDLLEGYLTEHLGAFLTERDGLKESLAAKEAEVAEQAAKVLEMDKSEEITALTEKVDGLVTSGNLLDWKVKRFEAVAPQWMLDVVAELDQCDPTDLSTKATELRDAAIARYTNPGDTSGGGRSLTQDDDEDIPVADGLLTEDVVRNTR